MLQGLCAVLASLQHWHHPAVRTCAGKVSAATRLPCQVSPVVQICQIWLEQLLKTSAVHNLTAKKEHRVLKRLIQLDTVSHRRCRPQLSYSVPADG